MGSRRAINGGCTRHAAKVLGQVLPDGPGLPAVGQTGLAHEMKHPRAAHALDDDQRKLSVRTSSRSDEAIDFVGSDHFNIPGFDPVPDVISQAIAVIWPIRRQHRLDRGTHADPEFSAVDPGRDRFRGLGQILKNLRYRRQISFPFERQKEPVRQTAEQFHAQRDLKFFHLLAYRASGHAKLARRGPEAEMSRSGFEGTQRIQ